MSSLPPQELHQGAYLGYRRLQRLPAAYNLRELVSPGLGTAVQPA